MTQQAHAPGVIVAGMHRSSTSLVTSAFVACGYHLAPDQLDAKPDNPRGYFEDAQMHQLHRQLLESHDTAWDLSPRLRELRGESLTFPDTLQGEIRELVDYYRGVGGRWVWKNPRATLFLDEWARWFPEATFVICVRSPAAVVDSMLRRRDRMRISDNRTFPRIRRLFRGLSVWRSYNLAAYSFARRHPERTVVVRVPDDVAAIQSVCPGDVVDSGLLRRPRRRVAVLAACALRCRWLHWRLRRLADPARAQQLLGAPDVTPQSDDGHTSVLMTIRVAASIAVPALADLGYNLTF